MYWALSVQRAGETPLATVEPVPGPFQVALMIGTLSPFIGSPLSVLKAVSALKINGSAALRQEMVCGMHGASLTSN